MALAKSQRSLKAWGKQKWRTKSGKKSSETGERYLPEKAIKAMSSAEYASPGTGLAPTIPNDEILQADQREHRAQGSC